MKHLLTPLAALAILCASTLAQSIRTIGFNTTNGQVVANTGTNTLTFTNTIQVASISAASISATSESGYSINLNNGTFYGTWESGAWIFLGAFDFGYDAVAAQSRANLGFSINLNTLWTATNASNARTALGFSTNLSSLWVATNASNARSAVGLGATWLTNTNVTDFRTAIGLGATNQVQFGQVDAGTFFVEEGGSITFGANAAATTRANLGFGLSALTNTSNVTAMRALSGSTNTNHPYSGSISVTGTNNTNTLVFSNGILQSVQ